jgi:hypothetical protein
MMADSPAVAATQQRRPRVDRFREVKRLFALD